MFIKARLSSCKLKNAFCFLLCRDFKCSETTYLFSQVTRKRPHLFDENEYLLKVCAGTFYIHEQTKKTYNLAVMLKISLFVPTFLREKKSH